VIAWLAAERGADLLGDRGEPVAAVLERQQQRLVGALHLVGHREVLGLLELRLRLHAVAGDVGLKVRGRVARGLAEQLEERRADLLVGLLDDRGDLAVVVLQRVLLARARAGAHPEEQDEQQQHDAADRGSAPHQQRVVVRWRTPDRRTAARSRAAPGLVVLVEEGHRRRRL